MSNRAAKKMSSITAWENSKKAAMEAELKAKEVTNFSLSLSYKKTFEPLYFQSTKHIIVIVIRETNISGNKNNKKDLTTSRPNKLTSRRH